MTKTNRAIRECSKWLHYCLSIGWPKSSLDQLEALWWEYHDDYGQLPRRAGKGMNDQPIVGHSSRGELVD